MVVDPTTLIQKARMGDLAAFESLVRRYQREIFAYAVRLAPRVDLAEDLVQDVFIESFRSLDGYQGKGPFSQWLRGIVRNLARQQWQRLSQQRGVERDGLAEFVEQLADRTAKVDPLILSEQVAAMGRCMGKLTDRASQLVRMRHVQGLNSQEIARLIGGKASTVRMGLTRVLETLRRCMDRELKPASGLEG